MESKIEYLLCLGDSLTFGARDEFQRSYPAELGRIFWELEKKLVYCIDHGVNGETSSQLLKRIYSNAHSYPLAKIALLLIGTNDTALPQAPDIYCDNLRQIIAVLKSEGKAVVMGLLPPIIGPGLPVYPANAQKQAENFNRIIKQLAKAETCCLADFRALGKHVIDTAHLNHAGYVAMAEIWYQVLKQNKLC